MTKTDVLTYDISKLSEMSQFDNSTAIENFIIANSDEEIPQNLLKHPHILNGVIFSICIRGNAKLRINMQEHLITANSIISLLPGALLEPLERSEDFLIETLFFSYDFIAELPLPPDFTVLDRIRDAPCLRVSDDEVQNLIRFHAFILEQYNRTQHIYRKEIVKSLLFALIADIGSIYSKEVKSNSTKSTNRMDQMTSSFFVLLSKNYKLHKDISFYADKMCLTPKYLTSTIKKLTGKSILEWINEVIMIEAKSILKSKSLTVSQISDELNFSDSSVFCRFFKKHTKMTPVQYRESGSNVRVTQIQNLR